MKGPELKGKPAVLGGAPAFESMLPITKPTLPDMETLQKRLDEILSTGMITNSKYVRMFEEEVRKYIGVEHAIGVSSCTAGLMLAMKSYGLEGEVILPSFTFSATGHPVVWNGLTPVFVDIDPVMYHIDIENVKEAITDKTSAILAVHLYGNPCDVNALSDIATDHGLKLIYDSAHAFGSTLNGRHVGTFGDAEVFSASPTKLMVTGEGGIVATSDPELTKLLRYGRNYGDDGSYDCVFSGLNARMSEFHGILGLESIKDIEQNVNNRNFLAETYIKHLSNVPGIKFQRIRDGARTTYKDFSILIDKKEFGFDRNLLHDALDWDNIMTRKYFYPPLHKQRAFADYYDKYKDRLPVTDQISENILCLPLYSHMPIEEVMGVCEAVKRIQNHASEVKEKIG